MGWIIFDNYTDPDLFLFRVVPESKAARSHDRKPSNRCAPGHGRGSRRGSFLVGWRYYFCSFPGSRLVVGLYRRCGHCPPAEPFPKRGQELLDIDASEAGDSRMTRELLNSFQLLTGDLMVFFIETPIYLLNLGRGRSLQCAHEDILPSAIAEDYDYVFAEYGFKPLLKPRPPPCEVLRSM